MSSRLGSTNAERLIDPRLQASLARRGCSPQGFVALMRPSLGVGLHATLTGRGPDVLRIIDRVGRDQGWFVGTCGKDGQGVPVSASQPTLRIPSIVVGGTATEAGEDGGEGRP